MAKFILDGQEYCGGGGSNQIVKLTQAEYDALSDEKLSNNTIYLITDSGELTAENLFYDGSQTGLGNNVQDAIDSCFQSVSDGKDLLASAITDKKVPTDADATFEEMANNISAIKGGSGNAVASDVKKGKTFTNDDGIEYTGTYDFSTETSATATASAIKSGKTAWVNGSKITGTLATEVIVEVGFIITQIQVNVWRRIIKQNGTIVNGSGKGTYLEISASGNVSTLKVIKACKARVNGGSVESLAVGKSWSWNNNDSSWSVFVAVVGL